MPTGHSDEGISLPEAPSSQMTQVCIKLTKKTQLNLIEELLSKTILPAKLYHIKSYFHAIECIMKSKLCDSI